MTHDRTDASVPSAMIPWTRWCARRPRRSPRVVPAYTTGGDYPYGTAGQDVMGFWGTNFVTNPGRGRGREWLTSSLHGSAARVSGSSEKRVESSTHNTARVFCRRRCDVRSADVYVECVCVCVRVYAISRRRSKHAQRSRSVCYCCCCCYCCFAFTAVYNGAHAHTHTHTYGARAVLTAGDDCDVHVCVCVRGRDGSGDGSRGVDDDDGWDKGGDEWGESGGGGDTDAKTENRPNACTQRWLRAFSLPRSSGRITRRRRRRRSSGPTMINNYKTLKTTKRA